eukprot:1138187-Pelagomonas_calceolata.AAC.4
MPPDGMDNCFFSLGKECFNLHTQLPHMYFWVEVLRPLIADKKEVTDLHHAYHNDYDIILRHPQLIERRRLCCSQIKRTRTSLLDFASNYKMIITTGHTYGDNGQPMFIGYDRQHATRPGHFPINPTGLSYTLTSICTLLKPPLFYLMASKRGSSMLAP